MRTCFARPLPVMVLCCGLWTAAAAGTVELDTSRATQPTVAVSPDGHWVVFTMLGHLFRLPAEGGTAEQITFGPSYDSEPVFSPDGTRIAFVSDRDGSAGNVFVLEVPTGRIVQVTRELHAASPTWSPDGKTLAYLRMLAREEHPPELAPGFGGGGLGELRSVAAAGGEPEVLAAPKLIRSVFYLPDGRLAWTVIEYAGGGRSFFRRVAESRVEALGDDRSVTVLHRVEGNLGSVVPAPSSAGLFHVSGGELTLLPLGDGGPKQVAAISSGGGSAQFALTADAAAAFFSEAGQIVKVALGDASRVVIPFEAHVRMEVRDAVTPTWEPAAADDPVGLRSVMSPRLSPDGTKLVFIAAGDLWQQPLDGSPAARLLDNEALELDPAFSPDGRHLAFARNEHGNRALCLYDFDSRQVRTLVSLGDSAWGLHPSWKPDGQQVVFQRSEAIFSPFALIAVGPDGATEELAEAAGGWTPRPHFSPDGTSLYYTSRTENVGALYRMPLGGTSTAAAVTRLQRHAHDGLVSPDGKWVALRRNSEIWIAPLGSEPVTEEDLRRISPEGGRSFAFTPDGSALLYSAGARVWRQPLGGGRRREIPLRLQLRRKAPAPLLVRRVRVLDFAAGGFRTESSMLIAEGRIVWIGPEAGRDVPEGAVVVDAAGRCAIPGLFDLHVHSAWSNQQANHDAFIAYGITSVRDTGGRLDVLAALQDRSELTDAALPRYFFSGEIFEGASPLWGDAFLQIYDEQEAREHVRRWKQRGAQFIKVYPSLPWPLQRAVADEARRLGLPMVGHGLGIEEIVKSVTLGYAVLEHAAGGMEDDLLQLLAATDTKCDPTLSISGSGMVIGEEPERLEEAKFRTFVPSGSIQAGRRGGLMSRFPMEVRRARWRARLEQIRTAHEHGVSLRAGTDSLMTGTFFGPSLHWELEHFAEAGLSPIEVLRMATAEAAQTVGAQDDLGTLEPGKLADLVLLDRDPLEEIRNTQSIWRVIKDGRVFDPATLRP